MEAWGGGGFKFGSGGELENVRELRGVADIGEDAVYFGEWV